MSWGKWRSKYNQCPIVWCIPNIPLELSDSLQSFAGESGLNELPNHVSRTQKCQVFLQKKILLSCHFFGCNFWINWFWREGETPCRLFLSFEMRWQKKWSNVSKKPKIDFYFNADLGCVPGHFHNADQTDWVLSRVVQLLLNVFPVLWIFFFCRKFPFITNVSIWKGWHFPLGLTWPGQHTMMLVTISNAIGRCYHHRWQFTTVKVICGPAGDA